MADDLLIDEVAAERHPRTVAILVAVAAVGIALLVVMLAPATHVTQNPPLPAVSPSPADDVAIEAKGIGTLAPLNFVLKDINGVDVNLASFKGKVIVLNFWATWCPPCRAEIPGLVALQSEHPDDVVMVGLLVQDPLNAKTRPFASAMKMNYPVLDANDREDQENAYGPFWGIPASVVIGRDGRIANKHSGLASKEQFDHEIKALM